MRKQKKINIRLLLPSYFSLINSSKFITAKIVYNKAVATCIIYIHTYGMCPSRAQQLIKICSVCAKFLLHYYKINCCHIFTHLHSQLRKIPFYTSLHAKICIAVYNIYRYVYKINESPKIVSTAIFNHQICMSFTLSTHFYVFLYCSSQRQRNHRAQH